MADGYKTIKTRFEMFDSLRLYLLRNSPVTAKQVSEEFNITTRQAKEYMYALDCQKIGNQRTRAYTYKPSAHLLELVNRIADKTNE